MLHFLKMLDLSSKEIQDLLDLADRMKYDEKHALTTPSLSGRNVALVFRRPTTRSRISLEVGINQLGGRAMYLPAQTTHIERGEPLEDTARTLSRYCDAVVLHSFEQSEVEALARYGSIPVINARTDFAHPLRALADLMTIREHKRTLAGLKLAVIGDGSGVMNSAIIAALKSRMSVAVACPEGCDPPNEILEYAAQAGRFELYRDPRGAARAADAVITTDWNLGSDNNAERIAQFSGFTLNTEIMNYAKSDALVLHALPARRGREIAPEMFELHSTEIFDSCENLLHVEKAVFNALMGY